jgi:nucleolar protein 56
MERFGKVVGLTAFKPFSSAANALEQINAVSEAQLTDDLKAFLTMNLPKVGSGWEGMGVGGGGQDKQGVGVAEWRERR